MQRRRCAGPKSDALLDRADVQRDLELAEKLGLTLAQFDALPAGERDLWIARRARKRGTCPDCGHPISECSDPNRIWYPIRRVCYVTMARSAAQWKYDNLHKDRGFHDGSFTNWSKTRSDEHLFAHGDGVTIDVIDEDATPWDEFTRKEQASPVPHEPESGDGQIHEGE